MLFQWKNLQSFRILLWQLITLKTGALLSEHSEERRPGDVKATNQPAESCKTCSFQTEAIKNAMTKEEKWLRGRLLTLENHFEKQEKHVADNLPQIRKEVHFNTTEIDKKGELYGTVKNYENKSSRHLEKLESDITNYQPGMLSDLAENESVQMEYYRSEMKKRDEVIDKQNLNRQPLKEEVNGVKDIRFSKALS